MGNAALNDVDIPQADLDILHRLAERKAAIATDPVNEERRSAWYALDAGEGDRVMVLAEHGGIRDPRKPISDIVWDGFPNTAGFAIPGNPSQTISANAQTPGLAAWSGGCAPSSISSSSSATIMSSNRC